MAELEESETDRLELAARNLLSFARGIEAEFANRIAEKMIEKIISDYKACNSEGAD